MDSERELEVIRDEMEQTRSNLADKLGALEEQVRETVSTASETVTSTVEGVKEVVSNVTDTVGSVTDTLNVPKQVEQHPWIAIGVAVAAGFAAAQLLGGSRSAATGAPQGPQPQPLPTPPPQPAYQAQPRQEQQHKDSGPSLLSQAASMLPSIESIGDSLKEKAASMVPSFDEFGPELKKLGDTVIAGLGGLAVGGVMNLVRELAADALPDTWKGEVTKLIDDVTQQLGGKPLQSRQQQGGEKQPDQQHRPAEGQGGQHQQQKPNEQQGQGNTTRGRREGRNQLVGQG